MFGSDRQKRCGIVRRVVPVAALLFAVAIVLAPPVRAFPLTDCTMSVESFDANGAQLDAARGPDDGATLDDPLLVDWDGRVTWSGVTNSVLNDYSWHVEVFYIPTPERGGSPNTDAATKADRTITIREGVPFRFTGLYFISGAISGAGGSCQGSGWVQVTGSPIGTLPFVIGSIVALVGALLLIWGAIGYHPVTAIAGGLLGGVGLGMLLVIFSVVPFRAATPLAVLAIGAVVGIAAGLIGRRRATRAARR